MNDNDNGNAFQKVINWFQETVRWFRELLDPLIQAAGDTAIRREILLALNLPPDQASQPIAIPASSIDSIDVYTRSAAQDVDLEAFVSVVQDMEQIWQVFEDFISAAKADQETSVEELINAYLNMLTLGYIRVRNPWIYILFKALGVLEEQSIRYGGLVEFFTQAGSYLKGLYGDSWDLETEAHAGRLSDGIMFPVGVTLAGFLGADILYGWDADPTSGSPLADSISDRTLSLSFEGETKDTSGNTVAGKLITSFVLIPKEHHGPALLIHIKGSGSVEVPLSRNTSLKISVGAPDAIILIPFDGADLTFPTTTDASIGLSLIQKSTEEYPVIFGDPDGTHFRFGKSTLEGKISTKDYGIKVSMKKSSFTLSGGKADGFIKKMLPSDKLKTDFDFGLGFSQKQGLFIEGSAGLLAAIPLHKNAGPLKLQTLTIGLKAGDAASSFAISIESSLSFSIQIGSLTATVDRIGLETNLDFPEGGGNLGPIQVDVGFLPPTGVGLAVDAAGITGGGFLEFDHANKRYAGVLALNFSEIGLVAIGLITTRLPDGSEGFSLLINIGVTFDPPIQLSFGFTLSGVGGLIGVNRTMEIDALRTGLKNRTLDSILFPDPDTVIANASKIISDLRTVFPPAEGRYVVGPMVKIGWGSPTIITADIGIFLEFPDPIRVVLMGQVAAAFPAEKQALVLIHLDVLGVIDFQKEELTFQASLYDSRILSYTLSGDSAFLLGWGQDPRFALSLGGFHPRFTPPPPPIVFADLKRLTLSISKGGGVLKLSCQAYQALTPNSLQFGARVDLYASAGGLIADGHLGFDALFYFSPFSFEVEICGGVHIKYKGVSLLSVDLTLLLSGPTPWHARGKAKIKILFVSVKVGFSFTWGRDEQITLPPVDPWESLPEGKPLPEVLEDPHNWGTVLPAGHTMVESLRSLETEAPGQIIVHPAGRLEVRQNVVPLGVRLDKVGNAPITGHDLFDITELRVNGDSLHPLDPVEEYFARGQFEELPTDQKLSLPAFERMKAGVTTASSEAIHPDGAAEVKTLAYESILINQDRTSTTQEPSDVSLFSTSLAFQSDLERRTLSQDFRQVFEKQEIFLSPNDRIIITPEAENHAAEEESNRWRIYDSGRDQTYMAIKESETLEISGEINWFDWNEAEFIVKASATRKAAQRAGPQKRFSTLRPQPKVSLDEERYCIVNALDLTPVELEPDLGAENRNLTRMAADQVLQAQLEQRPEQAGELMVIPEYEVAV